MSQRSLCLTCSGIWVFGYGSLAHTPGFEHSARVEGCIQGWRRVWHQGSTDHRGTPAAPGRTVTLEQSAGAVTWGVAYRVAGTEEHQAETVKYLEWREKQYDQRHRVDVRVRAPPALVGSCGGSSSPSAEASSCSCGSGSAAVVRGALLYVASEDTNRNVNYLGPAPEEQIALQIATAVGPSGRNRDYLFELAGAMRQMGVEDAELFALEARVQDICDTLHLDERCGAAASSSAAAASSGGADMCAAAVRHALVVAAGAATGSAPAAGRCRDVSDIPPAARLAPSSPRVAVQGGAAT